MQCTTPEEASKRIKKLMTRHDKIKITKVNSQKIGGKVSGFSTLAVDLLRVRRKF